MNSGTPAATGFWQRRIRQPVLQQLTQGMSAEKVALTLTLGLTLGIFPILGSTTLLNAFAAWLLKLNQPVIQAVTILVFPLQCLLLIPFYRTGEALFGGPSIPLSIPLIIQRFLENTGRFMADYGMTGVRGIIVWAMIAPPLGGLLYFILRKPLRVLAARLRPAVL